MKSQSSEINKCYVCYWFDIVLLSYDNIPEIYWALYIVTYKGIKHTTEKRTDKFYLRRTSPNVARIVTNAPMPIVSLMYWTRNKEIPRHI